MEWHAIYVACLMIQGALVSSGSLQDVYAVARPGRFSSFECMQMALHTLTLLQLSQASSTALALGRPLAATLLLARCCRSLEFWDHALLLVADPWWRPRCTTTSPWSALGRLGRCTTSTWRRCLFCKRWWTMRGGGRDGRSGGRWRRIFGWSILHYGGVVGRRCGGGSG